MHLTKPPFVPKIRSWEDTRYFEEEASISDVDDGPSSDSNDDDDIHQNGNNGEGNETGRQGLESAVEKGAGNNHETELKAFDNLLVEAQDNKNNKLPLGGQGKASKHPRERRRPRDKILRDKEVGKQVLELRKRSAFLGYAYRRPHGVENEFIGDDEDADGYIDDKDGMEGSAGTV